MILAVILTLLKVDRCFTMLTELQKSRKRLSIKVFKAKTAKGVNRLEPPFPACKTPIVSSILTPASIFERLCFKELERQEARVSVDSSVTEVLRDNPEVAN